MTADSAGASARLSWHATAGCATLADVHIVIVEDEPSIAGPLADGLRLQGFEPTVTASGEEALRLGPDADLVLLDLALPDLDGMEVCRRLRATSEVPIIVVSARDGELDRVMGLELGADDYVVKPFSLRELIARIHALTRRLDARGVTSTDDDQTVELGHLSLDRRTREVSVDGQVVDLTVKEFDLLAALLDDPGAVMRRERLMEDVWDMNWFGSTKTLDVHVASLRRKLGDPRWIETVRGVGFRAVAPPTGQNEALGR